MFLVSSTSPWSPLLSATRALASGSEEPLARRELERSASRRRLIKTSAVKPVLPARTES